MATHQHPAMKPNRFIGAGIAFGIAVGALVSIFLGDFAFWIAAGICLGVAGGVVLSKRSGRDNANSSDDSNRPDV
jgi:uncharacterized membrane protein YfcA